MKDLIKSVIESHRGYQNPVSVDALISLTHFDDKQIRNIVSELIIDDKMPIGSIVEGYFYITNTEDLARAKAHLLAPIEATVKRAKALEFNYAISTKVQGEFL